MAETQTQTIQDKLKGAFMVEDAREERQDEREAMAVIDFNMVGFSLAGKDYGIDIMNVKEIARAGEFTYVPNSLPFVVGVYNLRGDIIPILDMRLFFNIPADDDPASALRNLLVLTVEDQTFGAVVDKIDKVVGVQKNKIQPPHPLFGDINIKYISGVVEAENRLYILLDIAKIFNTRVSDEDRERVYTRQTFQQPAIARAASPAREEAQSVSQAQAGQTAKPSAPATAADAPSNADSPTQPTSSAAAGEATAASADELRFIADSLATYRKFSVTPLNSEWVTARHSSWLAERGKGNTQLQSEADADAFLKPFWSRCTGAWWTKEYADAVLNALPDNQAKQIFVWNPGCGKGMESYSLACVLRKKYPSARLRIYAQDIDLLNISNAPLLSVPAEATSGWYAPYLAQKANGEYTFTQDIKDSIMFEYHDCRNTNALPVIDIIFARDVLSLLPQDGQNAVIADFDEKVKGNGIVILGENERLPASSGFEEKMAGTIRIYAKR